MADSLFSELKRRNVFKVGVAYLVLAWVVVQITDSAVPAFGMPGWVNTVVFYFGLIGFPFVIFFSWAFEITPEGIKKESEISAEDSITAHTGRKLDFIIISLLVVGLGYFIWESRFQDLLAGSGLALDGRSGGGLGAALHRPAVWRPGSKLLHPFNPELGIGVVRGVEGRFLLVHFPGPDQEFTLAAEGSGLSRLILTAGARARLVATGEDVVIAEAIEHRYRLADGREVGDIDIWPLGISDSPVERLANLRLDSAESFCNRLAGLQLMSLREAGGLGSFLGGRIELFPHQLHTAQRAVQADPVRWLLADEVGLAELQLPKQPDEVWLYPADAHLEGRLLPSLPNRLLNLFLGTQDHVLDPGGLNAPIGDEFFQTKAGNLPPDGVKTGNCYHFRSVVDYHVDSG